MNDVFRVEYKEVTEETKKLVTEVKLNAQNLLDMINTGANPDNQRELAVAKTKLEESIMWAVKGLTK